MKKIYSKQNSFLKFHSLNYENKKNILKSIKVVLNDKKKS